METYIIENGRAAYYAPLDILYVGYGDNSLDKCHEIEDTPSGITVMYDDNNNFAGAEVYSFSSRISSIPGIITIDAKNPFKIFIPELTGHALPQYALA